MISFPESSCCLYQVQVSDQRMDVVELHEGAMGAYIEAIGYWHVTRNSPALSFCGLVDREYFAQYLPYPVPLLLSRIHCLASADTSYEASCSILCPASNL